ncbi:trypsin-like serine protease, partial [Martensiomyces pterosporus]
MCPFRSLSLGVISLVLAVAVAAAASSLPTYHGLSKRVIGGSKAQSTDYPFAVFISSPDVTNSTACAGAILTDQIIVTSAYCVYDPAAKQAVSEGNIRVGFGNSNLGSQALVPVKKIIVDSTYTPATGVDDIALLQVNLTQYISDKVNRVPLYIGTLQSGDSLTFMGWGSTNAYSGATSNDLNYAKVIVGDDATCKNATSPYTNTNGRAICTLNKLTPNVSPCLGDYGGPLITYDNNIPKLVGVFSSFVTMGGKLDRCANSNTMALYTHVYSYISFLKAKTGLSDDAFT